MSFGNKCVGIRGWVRIGRFCGSHVIWKYRGVPHDVEILEVHGEKLNVLPNSEGRLVGVYSYLPFYVMQENGAQLFV